MLKMKEYKRSYPLFSLCGLNCGLCAMHHSEGVSRCPGCGGENFSKKHPACAVVACSLRHGGVEYCFQCDAYPCEKYRKTSEYDSFITYRRVLADFEKAERGGLAAYQTELDEKVKILRELLRSYNDGRRKSFFCTAVNLLELTEIKEVLRQLRDETKPETPIKEKALTAARLFQAAAKRGVSLKLRKNK